MMSISRGQYNTLISLSVAGFAVNAVWLHEPALGIPLSVLFAFLLSIAFGTLIGKKQPVAPSALLGGALLFFSSWTVVGSLVYWLWRFALPEMIASAAAFAVVGSELLFRGNMAVTVRLASLHGWRIRWTGIIPALASLAMLALAARELLRAGTEEAIRSPWEVLPLRFLVFLGASVFFALLTARIRGWLPAGAVALAAALAMGLLVAASVYRVGYGFDPFVHEGAIRSVTVRGTIEPKTPFYVGAYVDIASFSVLTGMDLSALLKIAGPWVGLICLIAAAAIGGALAGGGAAVALALAALGPLSHLVQTTPQGMADAFALLAASLAYAAIRDSSRWRLAFAAAAVSLAIHPIAGGPALLAVALVWGVTEEHLRRLPLAAFAGLAALFLFPTLAFLGQGAISSGIAPLADLQGALAGLLSPILSPLGSETSSGTRGILYLGRALLPLALLAAAVAAAWRAKRAESAATWALLLTGVVTSAGGMLLAVAVSLDGVPAFERAIFPLRFVALGGILIFPLALDTLIVMTERLMRTTIAALSVSSVLALAFAASVYLAYPRLDPEDRSKGYSVSAATIDAVDLIHGIARGNYVVLANPTAAAAEIRSRGFARYYKGEFFYATPSGSPGLYAAFVEATDGNPSRERMRRVMQDYAVDAVYLVVHDYWKRFPQIIAVATTTADATWEIDGGKVMVFEYRK